MRNNRVCAFMLGLACLAAAPAGAQTTEPFRIGLLGDQSSVYAATSGPGSVLAIQLAIEDFGGKVLGRPIELLVADHQNKADVGSAIVRDWLDNKQVQAIFDLQTSSVALAAIPLIVKANKVGMISASGSSDLTGKYCTPNTIHWTYDTYAISQVIPEGLLSQGLKSWFFITTDYAFGHALERDISAAVTARGGTVVGSVKVPLSSLDFSSALLVAQSSGAQVVVLGGGGTDAVNELKQSAEYQIPKTQRIVSPISMITDVEASGLNAAQGLYITESFYWDLNDKTRAWSKRYIEKFGRPANMLQAGNYGSALHYLKAVQASGTTNGTEVVKAMKRIPVDDFMTQGGSIREDGRVMRNMYLFQVKSPAESKYKFDDYKLVATFPGEKAFRSLAESECPLVKK